MEHEFYDNMNKILAFDLDGTLCETPDELNYLGHEKYLHSKPKQEMIDIVNRLHDNGNTIVIYTSRGMSTFNGDLHKIYEKLFDLTTNSLNTWGVKYDMLVLGKVEYDLIIDDKAINASDIDKIEKI